MTEDDKKRRYQAYLLSNAVKNNNLKVSTQQSVPKVAVTNTPMPQYKLRVATPAPQAPTAKVTTPYNKASFYGGPPPDMRSNIAKLGAQLNPYDNNRTWKQPTATNADNLRKQIISAGIGNIPRTTRGVGFRVRRAGIGAVEPIAAAVGALSGWAPGQSPAEKMVVGWGANVDKQVKDKGLNTVYKGTEVPVELAQFIAGGGVVTKGMKYGPKFLLKGPALINKTIDKITGSSKVGKFIASGLKDVASPGQAIPDIAASTKYLSEESNRGKNITPGRVALEVGTAVGGGFAANKLFGWIATAPEQMWLTKKIDDYVGKTSADEIANDLKQYNPEIDDIIIRETADDIAEATTREEVAAALDNAQTKLSARQSAETTAQPTQASAELPVTIAAIDDPAQVKDAIKPLFPALDEPTIDNLSKRLAKATDATETNKILQEARDKQAQLAKVVDEATPEQPPISQEQTIAEQVPVQQNAPVAGAKQANPEIQANQVTQEPTGPNIEIPGAKTVDYNQIKNYKTDAAQYENFRNLTPEQAATLPQKEQQAWAYTRIRDIYNIGKTGRASDEFVAASELHDFYLATGQLDSAKKVKDSLNTHSLVDENGVKLTGDKLKTAVEHNDFVQRVANKFNEREQAFVQSKSTPVIAPKSAPIADDPITYAQHLEDTLPQNQGKVKNAHQKAKEFWDPQGKLVEEDRAYAKAKGFKSVDDLPVENSLQQLFRKVNNAESRTHAALLEQNLQDIFATYAKNDTLAKDFNNYTMFMLDLERRADKRDPIFTYTTEQLKSLLDDIKARMYAQGISTSKLDADAQRLSRGLQNIQSKVVNGPNSFVGADEWARIAFKQDGTPYKYYRPVKSRNQELHGPEVKSGNAVSIQEQRVFTDLSRADNARDDSFAPIFSAVDMINKQEAQVELGRELLGRQQEGLLKDANLIVDSETTKRIDELKSGINEIRGILKTFKTAKQAARFKVQKSRMLAKQSQKTVLAETKKTIRAEGKAIVAQLRKDIAREQLKIAEGKGKLGLPKYKKDAADSAAARKARSILAKDMGGDDDAIAAVKTLSKKDMVELFEAIANDAPIPKGVRGIYKKLQTAQAKLDKAKATVDKSTESVENLRAKISEVFETGESAQARETIKNASDEDLMLFARDVIDNDMSTPALRQAYSRFTKKSAELKQLAEDYEFMKLDIEQLDNAKNGMKQEIATIRPGDTTNRQLIHGLDAEGNKFTLEISTELARALQPTPFNASGPYKFARHVGDLPRQAFVGYLNPAFQINQIIWNIFFSPAFTKQGYKTINPKAVKLAFKATMDGNNELAMAVERGGIKKYGANMLEQAYDSSEAAKRLGTTGSIQKKINSIRNPKELHQYLNELAGNSDRFARMQAAAVEYRKAIKEGVSQEVADARAAAAYNDALPDFSNLSHAIRNIDAVILFAGAGQAGTRKMLRAFRDRPVKTTATVSAILAPIMGLTLYNMSRDDMNEYYKDMYENNRAYDVQNNIIIGLPGKIKKNEDTGEWEGIVKIPIIPELRPAQKAIVDSIYSIVMERKAPAVSTYARALFDTVTGQAFTGSGSKNPAMEEAWRQVNNQDRYGNKLVEPEMSSSQGLAARAVSAAKNTMGVPGRAIVNQATPDDQQKPWEDKNVFDTYVSSFTNKLYGSKGSTSGSRYFKNTDDAFNKFGLSGNERKQYESVFMAGKKDAAGNDRNKGYYTKAAEAKLLLDNEKFRQVREYVEMKAREKGAPANPFYDLTKDQQRVVLQLQGLKDSPGNQEARNISTANEKWLYKYYDDSSKFYGEILGNEEANAGRVDSTGMPIPIPSDDIKAKQEQYRNIKDKTLRAKYIEENQDLVDYWDLKNAYQRYVRDQVGLPQFDKYPKASPEIQALQKAYNALPSKNGPLKKDGTPSSPARSAWIKAHPKEWAKMTEYWTTLDIYNLQQEGAQAVYENTQFSEDGMKNILDIAKYVNDNNGSSGYSSYGGYGSSKGSSSKTPNISNNLAQSISKVSSGTINQPSFRATPKRTKLKVKLPSGKGSKFKKITLN